MNDINHDQIFIIHKNRVTRSCHPKRKKILRVLKHPILRYFRHLKRKKVSSSQYIPYKHHLLDKWHNEEYASADHDWSSIGELKRDYKNYYRKLIKG